MLKIIKSVIYKYNRLLIVLFLLVISLLSFAGYTRLNTPFSFYEYYSLDTFFTTWFNLFFGSYNMFWLPADLLIYFFSKVIGSALAVNLFYSLMVFIAGFFSYKLAYKFTKNSLISLVAALFYILSIYGQFQSYWYPIVILYSLYPLVFYLFITIDKFKGIGSPVFLLSFLLFFLTGQSLPNIIYLVGVLMSLIVFTFFKISKRASIKMLEVLIFSGIISVSWSLPYYVPFFLQSKYNPQLIEGSLAMESPEWKSSSSSMHELLREMGSVNFYYNYKGWSYPNARQFIDNPLNKTLSYIFPAIFILNLLLSKRRKLETDKTSYSEKLFNDAFFDTYLLLLFTLAIFMSSGVYESFPFKGIYHWLYTNVPYFSIFRDSYKSMLIVHFVYYLATVSFLSKLKLFSLKTFRFTLLTILGSLLVLSYSFISGSFWKQELIYIPDYWLDLAREIKSKDHLVFSANNNPYNIYNFTEERGKNTTFFRPLFNNNIIYRQGGTVYADTLMSQFYENIKTKESVSCLVRSLGFLGVTNIINAKDVDYTYYKSADPSLIQLYLDSDKELAISKKTFGKLDYYAIPANNIYDTVYVPNHITFNSEFPSCIELTNSTVNSFATIDCTNCTSMPGNEVSLNVYSIDSTQYIINFSDTGTPFYLVFNNRFDNGWKLLEGNYSLSNYSNIFKILFENPYSINTHYKANGYFNSWFIENPATLSSHTLTLIYMPQLYFILSLIMAAVSFILTLLCFIIFKYVIGNRKIS